MELGQIVVSNFSTLLRCLDPTNELLGKLLSIAFVKDRISVIEQLTTLDDKNYAILRALREVPDDLQESVMNDFIAALRLCGQEHVANIFRPESYKVPMSDEHRKMLVKEIPELCKFLDPENGLLNELVSLEVITLVDYSRIRTKVGLDVMAYELISTILRKSDDAYQALIDSLIETGQSHVVHVLTGKREHGAESDKVPMSEEHRNMIIKQTVELCKYLDPENGLLNTLISLEVITLVENRRIRMKVGFDDKVTELISIIVRKSDDAFQALINFLKGTGQSHVAYVLTGEGDSRPVSEDIRKKLREKRHLVHSIFPHDLMIPLIRDDVFTSYD